MCSAGPCKSASTWFASVSRQEVRLRPPRPIISKTTRGGTPRSNRWRPPPPSSTAKGATAGIFRQDRAGRSREHHGHRIRAGPHLCRHQPDPGPLTLRQRPSRSRLPPALPNPTRRSIPRRPGRSGSCRRCSSRTSVEPWRQASGPSSSTPRRRPPDKRIAAGGAQQGQRQSTLRSHRQT